MTDATVPAADAAVDGRTEAPVVLDRAAPVKQSSPALPSEARRYISAWWFAGTIATALVLLVTPADGQVLPASIGIWPILGFALATLLMESLSINLEFDNSVESVSLIEAAVVTGMLALGGLWAFLATLAGITVAHTLRGSPLIRIGFNAAQFAVALAAALGVFSLAAGGADPLSGRGIAAATLAMIVFGSINWLAVTGIISRLEGRSILATSREVQQLSGSSLLSNTAVGILAAVVWRSNPAYALLMLVPILTLHAAYRGVARSAGLARQAVAERDRLDRIVVAASDGIALLNARGLVEVWSPALEAVTGVGAAEALGRPVSDVLRTSDVGGDHLDIVDVVSRATPDRPSIRFEAALASREGLERIVRIAGTATYDAHDRTTAYVLLVQDITRQREVERLKDDFLMRVSHELRTPLTPIKGYAESLLMNRHRMGEDLVDGALDRIVDRADHMVRLIDDLLLVSTMRARPVGERDVRADALDTEKAVAEIVAGYRQDHPTRTFVTRSEHPPIAAADGARFGQILHVLLDNAVQYSDPGSDVEVDIRRVGGAVEVRVTDQGRGIPKDHLERIFERFHRVEDPLLMTTSGLGVGLYVARHLAESMGGTLTVESVLGRGATFTLRLPTATSERRDRQEAVLPG